MTKFPQIKQEPWVLTASSDTETYIDACARMCENTQMRKTTVFILETKQVLTFSVPVLVFQFLSCCHSAALIEC